MTTVADIGNRITGARVHGASETQITGVSHDSRSVRPGDLFVALAGDQKDGRRFVAEAISNGAVAVMSNAVFSSPISQIIVDDPRDAMGYAAATCAGDPFANMLQVGVTGTNGKTTVTYIAETVLTGCGLSTGVMGTIDYRFGHLRWPATHTTPEATVIQATGKKMLAAGARAVVMEVSSHGLSLGRLNGCHFDVVGFTNLTQDHLDFHKSMEEYGAAKLQLFTRHIQDNPDARIVVNRDDSFSDTIMQAARHPVLTVSCDVASDADFHPVHPPVYTLEGIHARIGTPTGIVSLETGLIGKHNLSNVLLVLGMVHARGLSMERALRQLSAFAGVPGRLERISCAGGFSVFVDYAHTPDALERVLASLAPLTSGRIICVFGCGGDRDSDKRPIMGKSVAQRASVAVVTTDNPRTEDPGAIIDMIVPGLTEGGLSELTSLDSAMETPTGYLKVIDRRQAIGLAVRMARPGDAVLIAGKGHEDYVVVGTQKYHFDDREEAAAALKERGVA